MLKALQTIVKDAFILVFNSETLDVVKTAEALLQAGINNMELTCRVSNPLEKISALKKELPEFEVGAASLIDFPEFVRHFNCHRLKSPLPSVDQVVEAGADYLVSAVNFSDETYEKYKGKLPIVPGCGSLTEIVSQYEKGANFCKLFPASALGGVNFISAIDPAIHKMISIMPTGGTNNSNIPDYIKAGVLIFGGSFSMIDAQTLQRINTEHDYNLLAQEFKKVKSLINECRAAKYPEIDFSTASLKTICKATGRNFNVN